MHEQHLSALSVPNPLAHFQLDQKVHSSRETTLRPENESALKSDSVI